jgi:hypothetical protein
MSKQIIDDDSEIAYKWSKRYMLDKGKAKNSDKNYGCGNYSAKPKKRYLNRPQTRTPFKPFLSYCASCHNVRCGLVLLRRYNFFLGLRVAYGIFDAVKARGAL